jgi:hypothetical protein
MFQAQFRWCVYSRWPSCTWYSGQLCWPANQRNSQVWLKGTVSRDFRPSVFFHQNIRPGLLIKGLKPSKIFEFFKMHAVSLTPHAQKIFPTTSKSKKSYAKQRWYAKKFKMHAVSMTPHARCMRCHWYRMHNVCGVIDTACKIWHRMHDRRTILTALAAF